MVLWCAAVTEEEAGEALEHGCRTVPETDFGRKDGRRLVSASLPRVELDFADRERRLGNLDRQVLLLKGRSC